MTLEVSAKYTFDFKGFVSKLRPFLPILGVLFATAITGYSTTLDVPEPPPDPIVITEYVLAELPEPIVITKTQTVIREVEVPCPQCPDCPEPKPEPVAPVEPEQPAWYLGGNGDDDGNGGSDNGNGNGDDPNGGDSHGHDHGGHGGHGGGHGHGHSR